MSELEHDIPGLIAVGSDGAKIACAYAVSPLYEAGIVWILEEAPWSPSSVHRGRTSAPRRSTMTM